MIKKNSLKNIAIIMDGNGRWAKKKKLLRSRGHEEGAINIRNIVKLCSNIKNIESLTLYAFSTENWNRPKYEVLFLLNLLEKWLQKELNTYQEFKIKFKTIGDISIFSKKIQESIRHIEYETRNNKNLTKYLAINYGGREEIVRAVNILLDTKKYITVESIGETLDTNYQNIDLLIRTGGEYRVSNFLLWQINYAEFFFTKTLWPDFTSQEFKDIINLFHKRERRFGK